MKIDQKEQGAVQKRVESQRNDDGQVGVIEGSIDEEKQSSRREEVRDQESRE
jgi:hypothetical protein